ncbi:MAG: hypothetical protein V3R93_05495 [Candidatus Hydrothermarchaeaceae archaeon]
MVERRWAKSIPPWCEWWSKEEKEERWEGWEEGREDRKEEGEVWRVEGEVVPHNPNPSTGEIDSHPLYPR